LTSSKPSVLTLPIPIPITVTVPVPAIQISVGDDTTKSTQPLPILPPLTAITASHINIVDAGRAAARSPIIESGAYGLKTHLEMPCLNHQCLASGSLAISRLALPTVPISPVTVGADDYKTGESAAADADVSRPNENTNTTSSPESLNSCYTALLFGVLPFPLRQLVSPPISPLSILVQSRLMKRPLGSAI
jgi:hypothetical protein